VPHQANKRIIDATAKKLGIAPEKVVMTVAATATHRRPRSRWRSRGDQGRPHQAGDLVLLEAMGGGFTWGSALLRW
jgi:3-oxoacyl-[acyl-carrier-protein] synthase III